MSIIDWLRRKRQTDRVNYLESSVRTLEGSGTFGQKPWPFNYRAAVEQCQSWVYRCAMGNAQAAAAVPLRMYARKLNRAQLKARGLRHGCVYETRPVPSRRRKRLMGDDPDRRPSNAVAAKLARFGDDFIEVVDDHPVLETLRQANVAYNGFNLALFRFLAQELTGNAYLFPIIDDAHDRPRELWPMLPQWTWAIPGGPKERGMARLPGGDDEEDYHEQLIAGYVYGADRTSEQRFEPGEVLHFRYPNIRDLIYGQGKVEAAWTALGIMVSERVMQKALFDNHARPDWLLTVENASQDQVDRWKSKIGNLLRGVHKSGDFLALAGKVTAQPLQFSPNEVGSTDGIIEEVAGVFGYPITKLKANDPNRANAETGDAGWMKDTILPMLRQDEEALNQNGYLALFGSGALLDDVVLAYDDPIPANRRQELTESKTLVAAGLRTPDEDRALRGDEPLPDGVGALPRVNGQRIDLLDEQVEAAIAAQRAQAEAAGMQTPGGFGAFMQPPPPAPAAPQRNAPAADSIDIDAIMDRLSARDAEVLDGIKALAAGVGASERAIALTLASSRQGTDDDPGRAPAATLSHRAVMAGQTSCGCGEGDAGDATPLGKFLGGQVMAKADAAGDADDTVREGEPETLIDRFTRAMAEALEQQRRELLEALAEGEPTKARAKATAGEIERLLASLRTRWNAQLAERLRELVREAISVGGAAGLERLPAELRPDFDGAFDVTNPRVLEFVDSYTMRLAGQVEDHTLDHLQRMTREWAERDQPVTELAKEIEQDPSGLFDRNRAEMIARTESARAFVQGEELGWQESGAVAAKRWLLSSMACEFCRAAAAEVNRRINELGKPLYQRGTQLRGTDGGLMKLDYEDVGGPPLHPHCRCDLVPVLARDVN